MRLNHIFIAGLFCLLACTAGCDSKPKFNSLDQAHKKFVEYCKIDGYDAVLKPFENTLWIYVPSKKKLFDIRATGYGINQSSSPVNQKTVRFADVRFMDNTFHITYDISDQTNYLKDFGYGSPPKDHFNNLYQGVLNNIARTYLEVETIPGERKHPDPDQDRRDKVLAEAYVGRVEVPEFFVVVFADITLGIEMRITFNFTDFKKERSQALAMDEIQNRRISRFSGNLNMIGDREGKYLDAREITWPEFLSGQILTRINNTYAKDSRSINKEPEEAVLEAVARTVKIYQFEDYEAVILNNLVLAQQKKVDKYIFDDYDIKEQEPQGTLHTIKFDRSGNIVDDIVE